MARQERGQGLVRQSQANLWTVLGGIAAVLSLAIPLLTARRDEPPVTPGPPATTGQPATIRAPAPVSQGAPAPTVGTPGGILVVDQQVRLGQAEGVDVDVPHAQPATVDGPNGSIDLHYNFITGLRVNGGSVYTDQGAEQDAWTRCHRSVMEEKGGQPFGPIYMPGQQFCFRTSDRGIGWLRVNDWGRGEQYVVFNVRVWAAPPP